MEAVRISSSIMSLKRTPAEKVLLARICERAASAEGVCIDSNKELGQALDMHLKTVSDLINRLQQANLLQANTVSSLANKRTLTPTTALLTDYPSITDRGTGHYPSNTERYPSNTDSALPERSVRHCPVTGIEITHQRQDCRYPTPKTLSRFAQKNGPRFDELVKRLLTADQASESVYGRCYYLAKAIRKIGTKIAT